MKSQIGSFVTTLLIVLTTQAMKGEPAFSFNSTSIPGVNVIPPRSETFNAKVNEIVDPAVLSDIQGILPFTYILQNSSDKTVIAYAGRWVLTDSDGHITTTYATWWNLSTLKGGDAIAPGESRLMSPIPRLGIKNYGPTGTALRNQVQRFASLFSSKAQVELAVDSVVFDDGKAFGPNLTNTAARAQAFLDAERAVADAPPSQIVAAATAAVAPQTGSARIVSPLSDPPTYSEALIHYQQRILTSLGQTAAISQADAQAKLVAFRQKIAPKRSLKIIKQN